MVVMLPREKWTKRKAKTVDLKIVDIGIPYCAFPNNPFKNGHKHATKYTLHNTSPIPLPFSDVASNLTNFITRALSWSSKIVVPGTNIGDLSKVNFPASVSEPEELDVSFCVISKTLLEIPKISRMLLREPINQQFIGITLLILWLFHQHLSDNPIAKYSITLYILYITNTETWTHSQGSWKFHMCKFNWIINLKFEKYILPHVLDVTPA